MKFKSNLPLVFLSVIVLAFALLLWQNGRDASQLTRVKSSLDEMYNDRLLAEKYIYGMNNLVHEKKWRYLPLSQSAAEEQWTLSLSFERELKGFMKTRLTTAERKAARRLVKDLREIRKHESEQVSDHERSAVAVCDRMIATLSELEGIQVSEGSKLRSAAEKRFASSMVGLRMQSALYLVLLLSLSLLLKSLLVKPRVMQRHEWN